VTLHQIGVIVIPVAVTGCVVAYLWVIQYTAGYYGTGWTWRAQLRRDWDRIRGGRRAP
jgi:hypothetical protein